MSRRRGRASTSSRSCALGGFGLDHPVSLALHYQPARSDHLFPLFVPRISCCNDAYATHLLVILLIGELAISMSPLGGHPDV